MTSTTLLLVRHGQSEGNVAALAAQESGAEVIAVPARDADVPLSAVGVEQAGALGAWLGTLPDADRPELVWSSPYVRARQTAQVALDTARLPLRVRVDERLRDRELGVLDMLTTRGVDTRLPLEAERRRWVGKFYYRPPGGESWADIALRMRSFLGDLDRLADGRRVLVVCHDAVIMVARYVCEELTEDEVIALGGASAVGNASVTRLDRAGPTEPWRLAEFSGTDHLAGLRTPAPRTTGGGRG